MRERTTTDWASVLQIKKREFACGYCGNNVAADKGYKHSTDDAWIYLRPVGLVAGAAAESLLHAGGRRLGLFCGRNSADP